MRRNLTRSGVARVAAMFAVGTLLAALVLGLGNTLDGNAERHVVDTLASSAQAQSHDDDSGQDHGADDGHGTIDQGRTELGMDLDETHDPAHGVHDDGSHEEDHGGAPHLPSILDFIIMGIPGGADSPAGKILKRFAPSIFGVLVAILLAILAQAASRSLTLVPGRMQNAGEVVIGGLNDFILGIIGPEGKRFVPFLGTLFIYIWTMNMVGLVPMGFAATSSLNMTVALAVIVFVYTTFASIQMNGITGHLFHLAGEPRDKLGWALVPLMFPLHVIGEVAKPFSLAVRLFCNIFGEETLIAVFVGLGAAALAFLDPLPIGIPFHVPFVMLSLLLGTIQALVFMLLSTIYFALVMPHGPDEH